MKRQLYSVHLMYKAQKPLERAQRFIFFSEYLRIRINIEGGKNSTLYCFLNSYVSVCFTDTAVTQATDYGLFKYIWIWAFRYQNRLLCLGEIQYILCVSIDLFCPQKCKNRLKKGKNEIYINISFQCNWLTVKQCKSTFVMKIMR